MKNYQKLILLAGMCSCFACKKTQPALENLTVSDPETDLTAATATVTTVIAEGSHQFTDVEIGNNNVYLMENGTLKVFDGSTISNVALPAGTYTDFFPKFVAIIKNGSYYLRDSTTIKRIRDGQITVYKAGLPPLEDLSSGYIGNHEIAFDEADSSVIFGLGLDASTEIPVICKITKNGLYGGLLVGSTGIDGSPLRSFDVGMPGILWSGNFYFSPYKGQIYKDSLVTAPYGYTQKFHFGQEVSFEGPNPPTHGHFQTVGFWAPLHMAASRNGKAVAFLSVKPKFDSGGNFKGYAKKGMLKYFRNGVIKNLGIVQNGRLAISNDGKTIYIAGDGLFKVEL